MSIYTRDKLYLSADKATYMQYDAGAATFDMYVQGAKVASFAAASGLTLPIGLVRTSLKRIRNGTAKVGATSGWVLGGGPVNTGLLATLPASQTGSTLVVPLQNFKVGDTITAFHLVGQIESAGGTVTVDANLRKITAAAADVVDASVGAMTQLSVTADTIMSETNTNKASLTEIVGADETFYMLITATTAASTDIALQGIAVTVTEA